MADSEIIYWAEKGEPLTPEEVDNNFRWMENRLNAMAAWLQATIANDGGLLAPGIYNATDAGADDDYEVTLSPAPTALSDLVGKLIVLTVSTANVDENATLKCNSLAATAITKEGTTAIAAGDIKANNPAFLIYDGTQFQLKV